MEEFLVVIDKNTKSQIIYPLSSVEDFKFLKAIFDIKILNI